MDTTQSPTRRTAYADVRARSKKALFQEVSQRLGGELGLEPRDLFAALLEREKLGSTSMGRGVAIPHCRLDGVQEVHSALVKLEAPIEFDSIDGEPVDLFFFLVGPEDAGSSHLLALARASRTFQDAALVRRLRGACDADALLAALNEADRRDAA